MVVKKKKEEKTKKKVDKTKKKVVKKQVIKKDVKKNKQEIDKLKKQLKALSVKYLAERKKRTTPQQYQKVKKDIEGKVNNASSQTDLIKLISLLGGKGSQPTTTTITTPATQGTIKSRTEASAKKASKDEADKVVEAYRGWKGLKERIENFKDKYNNGTLTLEESAGLYKDIKKFAKGIYEELPTWEQTLAVYEGGTAGGKKLMDYLKRFMNQNRPANQEPVDLSADTTAEQRSQTRPTPPPPQAQAPTPTPPPPQAQAPTPTPPPPPPIADEPLFPATLLAGLVGIGGIGPYLYNRFLNNRQGENDRLVRRAQEQGWIVGAEGIGGGVGRAVARGVVAGGLAEGLNRADRQELDRDGLDSSQDLRQRVADNVEEMEARDTPELAREWLERREIRSRFRNRDAEREARGALGEAQLQASRTEQAQRDRVEQARMQAERQSGELDDMELRMSEGIGRNAGPLIRNFRENIQQQLEGEPLLDFTGRERIPADMEGSDLSSVSLPSAGALSQAGLVREAVEGMAEPERLGAIAEGERLGGGIAEQMGNL